MIDVTGDDGWVLRAFLSRLGLPAGELSEPSWLARLQAPGAKGRLKRSPPAAHALRTLLLTAGYDPRARGASSARRIFKAALAGDPPATDVLTRVRNGASLQSGLCVSQIDGDRCQGPLQIRPASGVLPVAAGHDHDATGLLALHDGVGPCASPVFDAARVAVHPGTRTVLSIVWGTGPERHVDRTVAWYSEMIERLDASSERLLWTPRFHHLPHASNPA